MTSEAKGRAIVYERSQGRCEVCQRPADTFHHRVKHGQGGTWDPANGLHLCGDGTRFCHGWIEANPAHAMTLGLWLPHGSDPAAWPAYLRPTMWPRGWWRPDNDGCWGFAHPPEGYDTRPEVAAAIAALQLGRDLDETRPPFSGFR